MSLKPHEIDEQAAQWAVRLSAGELATAEQSAFDRWLEADPRHRGALLRSRAAWVDLDRLSALAAHREPPRTAPGAAAPARSVRRPSFASRRWFIAASLTTAMAGGVSAWWWRRGGETYVSGVGEVRPV
ncbi:MAG: DUF4880 domain-containing protein, partial [Terriglobales bacterium]